MSVVSAYMITSITGQAGQALEFGRCTSYVNLSSYIKVITIKVLSYVPAALIVTNLDRKTTKFGLHTRISKHNNCLVVE